MSKSKIEWLDGGSTWNPVTGCTPISEGCKNCYAKAMAETRLRGRYGYDKDEPFKITYHPDKLEQPLKWKKPRMIFVCSMGDLFHDDVKPTFRWEIFKVMAEANHHVFLILTKRVEQMKYFFNCFKFLLQENIWVGATVEHYKHEDRIEALMEIPAYIKFISVEPMLSYVGLGKGLPDWVICGGETGRNARIMKPEWARSLRDDCKQNNIPFFFKKMGSREETPEDLIVREYPKFEFGTRKEV